MTIKGYSLKEIGTRAAILFLCIFLVYGVLFSGCTSQYLARHMGGTTTVYLPAGTKLMNASWKDTHLWYLVRPRHPGEPVETIQYREDSMGGMMNGVVYLKEQE